MPEKEEITLVCGTVGKTIAVEGSEVRWCSVCAADIWVSPHGLEFLEQHPGAKPLCMECSIGVMAADDDVKMVPVPGADPTRLEMQLTGLMLEALVDERRAADGR